MSSQTFERSESNSQSQKDDSEENTDNTFSSTEEDQLQNSPSDKSNNSPDILDSIDLSSEYQSVLERYYKPMYCVKLEGKDIEHHCLLFHSNRICLLTLPTSHPVIEQTKTLLRINYNVSGGVDRLKNKVSGKGKKGGQKLMPTSVVCQIECADGTNYKIRSCVKGKLIEMNQKLIDEPHELLMDPKTTGHIAVILCDLSTVDASKENMLSQEDFEKLLLENKKTG
ncbi:uncharacterized protein CBL_08932 [Carabus blaptoides fortunei]